MSIRLRLRSSNTNQNHLEQERDETSNMFNKELKPFPETYMQNECNICGKQQDLNEKQHWFISCSICTVQYHLRCLEIESILLRNNKSRAHKTWTCKECKRCWFCKNKRFDKSHLMSSLRAHPERDLNTLEMIICKQCDSSIHTLCFYKYLKNLPLKIRELRKRKKNFVCQPCENELKSKMKDKVNKVLNAKNSADSNDENISNRKDANNNILNNNTKQLHIQLKKLGITNVESMISNIDDNDNIRSTRSRKSANDSQIILGNFLPNKNDNNSLTNLDIDDSALQTFVNKKRKINGQYIMDKCSNKRSSTSKILNLERNCFDTNIDVSEKQNSPIKVHCSVPGCNSEGHLSGKYNYHSLVETCQLFHNQTMEECIDRYNKRKIKYSKLQSLSPRRFSIRKHRKSQKWDEIINERNLFNCTDPILNVASNRQPNLNGFTPKFDLDLFLEAQSRTAEMIHENSYLEIESNKLNNINTLNDKEVITSIINQTSVKKVQFGKHEISVWYDSPYSEFQNCLKLFICEFCLKCMNSSIILQHHQMKCPLKHPPGNEIYRKNDISFFEIDGNQQKEYCQNLCIFAKLFLDQKTLFFDVEPFLFYVMTKNDQNGMHLIGYFSKEKYSPNNYNVSCILILPHYQRYGYGRMLIEFSYLLTCCENKVGSPEKPLSDLGIISYRSYWKFIIMEYFSTFEGNGIYLKDISQQTGISSNDIVSTLQSMGIVKYWKGKHVILMSDEIRKQFKEETKRKRESYQNKMIDPKLLHWTPKNYSPNLSKK